MSDRWRRGSPNNSDGNSDGRKDGGEYEVGLGRYRAEKADQLKRVELRG
jgi:hypothetical protein